MKGVGKAIYKKGCSQVQSVVELESPSESLAQFSSLLIYIDLARRIVDLPPRLAATAHFLPDLAPNPPSNSNSNSFRMTSSATKKKLIILAVGVAFVVVIAVSVYVTVSATKRFTALEPEFGISMVLPEGEDPLMVGITPTSISVGLALMMNVSNPNKVGIKYNTWNMMVYYRGTPLGDSMMLAQWFSAGTIASLKSSCQTGLSEYVFYN